MKFAAGTMIAVGILATGLVACKPKVQDTAQQAGGQPSAGVPAPAAPGGAPGMPAAGSGKYFSGVVLETMDSGGYTYVEIDNGTEKIWAAAPQFEVKKGEKVTIPEGMPMQNYESKTLNRTFDVVYFVGSVGKGDQMPATAPGGGIGDMGGVMPEGAHPKLDPSQAAKDAKISFSGIKKADKTVAEIYAEQKSFGSKQIAVRGKVVKFSPQIMGKNWIHVQDGSGSDGTNDLTVTTADMAKVGDTVLVSGVITLNKDFGMGYKYDLIIEDGKVKVE